MGSDACLCGLRGEPALIWWPRGSSRVHGGEGGASIGGRILYAVCAMQYACISVHTGTSNNSCPRSVLGRNLSVTPPSCSHLQVRTVPLNTHFEPAWEAQLARPKPDLRIAIWAGNFPTLLFTAFLYGISQVRRMNLGVVGGKHREGTIACLWICPCRRVRQLLRSITGTPLLLPILCSLAEPPWC